ncbi:MAG TPA: putative porin [Verrucomicrobiae bacterium]|nr:putative porin [Verrucomicrobiae bacterium]
MKRTKHKWSPLAALALASAACATTSLAQTPDALLNKLVDKGILTAKEAEELKQDAKNDFSKAYSAKSGMPDWVTSLKINGDFRGRYEGHYFQSDEGPFAVQRDRFRYRVRLGAVATLKDDFEIGVRLASADGAGGFTQGNPVSASSTAQDNGTRKGIFVDLAYAKWHPLHSDSMDATMTLGKMENPFAVSYNVFDPDYNPEGFAGQFTYRFNSQHALKTTVGGFVLDELIVDTSDPYLLGAQMGLDSTWNKHWSSSLSGGVLAITTPTNLVNSAVPNINRGNTRNAAGAPATFFNPIVGDASVTYMLDSFPGYKGAFPIKLLGEYLNNPATSSKNEAYMAGVVFGKAGKKGLWELSYQYRFLGANSWYEELPDDDFVGFYQAQQANAGFTSGANPLGAGYGGGTNVRGHVGKLSYSPFDSLVFAVTYYNGTLIDENPAGSHSGVHHLLVDLIWKF